MQSFGEMIGFFSGMPVWLSHLIVSLTVTYTLCIFGVVFLRAGRSPLWSFLFLLPYVGVVALWVLAFTRWPAMTPEDQEQG